MGAPKPWRARRFKTSRAQPAWVRVSLSLTAFSQATGLRAAPPALGSPVRAAGRPAGRRGEGSAGLLLPGSPVPPLPPGPLRALPTSAPLSALPAPLPRSRAGACALPPRGGSRRDAAAAAARGRRCRRNRNVLRAAASHVPCPHRLPAAAPLPAQQAPSSSL